MVKQQEMLMSVDSEPYRIMLLCKQPLMFDAHTQDCLDELAFRHRVAE